MSLRLLPAVLLSCVLLAGGGSPTAWGSDQDVPPAQQQPTGVLRFRRVYVPAERIHDWPRDNVKYLPIEPGQFDRLLRAVRAAEATSAGATSAGADGTAQLAARAQTATYQARLVGDQLAAGRATLQVVLAAHEPVLLPLEPCNLAISGATWSAAGQGEGRPTEAILGTAADGKLKLLVAQSGQLEFDWSLGPHGNSSGPLDFRFELPACPTNRLILQLPDNLTPVVDDDRGIVQQEANSTEGLHCFSIELGTHHCFDLRLVPSSAAPLAAAPAPGATHLPQLPLVRESVEYDVLAEGLTAKAELNLTVRDGPLTEVALLMDPQLQLVSATCLQQPVPWSITPADGGRPTKVVLRLPQPPQATECLLQLEALAPLVTDRPWRLPRIRPAQMSWQEGTFSLLVSAPLLVQQLVPSDCRQSETSPLSAPQVGESAKFQCFSPQATAEIVLSRGQAPTQLASGTEVKLAAGEITARVTADLRVVSGTRFSLQADITQGWLIDSVQSVPPEAVDDWIAEGPSDDHQTLTVHLAKALSKERPLRLLVCGRRLCSPLGRELDINDLVPLRFRAAADAQRLVAVDVVGPYQMDLAGAEQLKRLKPQDLGTTPGGATQIGLFAELPRNLLFADDPGAAALRITLRNQEPRYAATLRVEAIVGHGRLRENYLLSCAPESARVDRVLVHLSHRRDAPISWTLGSEDRRQLRARPWSSAEQAAAGLDAQGETWELTLLPSRSETFEIRATREVDLAAPQPLSLAWLPEAAAQRATLVVRALGPKTPRVTYDHSRLQPIPAETVPPDQCQTAQATYRYDPRQTASHASHPAAVISRCDDDATPPVWVWDAQLESWYQASGTGQHLATYRLQNSACSQLKLNLPPGVEPQDVRGVWVDNDCALWRELANQGAAPGLAIELPPEKQFSTVSIHFTTRRRPLWIAGSSTPQLPLPPPEVDLPILCQHWTVWLPPGYEASAADLRWQSCLVPPLGLSKRLFGPLGRATAAKAFDPLAPGSWPAAATEHAAAQLQRCEDLLQVLGRLTAGTTAAPQQGGLQWGKLLGQESIDALPAALLVDRPALARLALTPQTLVQPGWGDTDLARGASLLQQAGLALLAHPDALVLTSQFSAALLNHHLAPLGRRPLCRVLPGPLAEQIQQAAAAAPQHNLVPLDTWRRQPAEPTPPWTPATLAEPRPADTAGWNAYQLDISAPRHGQSQSHPARLTFVHRQSMLLLGSIALLIMIALGSWTLAARPGVLVAATGIFGCAALLLPEAYAAIPSGLVLGALFCLAYGLIRRKAPPEPPADPGRSLDQGFSLATPAGTVIAFAFATWALSAAAHAQAPGPQSPPTASPVHHVLIPVDDKGQPTGARYYLPEDFYRQLYRRAAEASIEPQGCLVTAATYCVVLCRQSAEGPLAVEELRAVLDLHVFGLTARVPVPFLREAARLLPQGPLLDGRAIQAQWEPDDGVLVFEVPEPGRHRLELPLQPVLPAEAGTGFDLPVTPLANSRLELSIPPGAPAIEVPSAVTTGGGASGGGTTIRPQGEPLHAVLLLAPNDHLAVRWAAGTGPGGQTAVDVEELLWLNVQRGAVVLDAKLKFNVLQGQLRQLQLATDPHLRLDRLEGQNPPQYQVHATPGQPQIITLRWPRPVTDTVALSASFLVKDTSPVGNLRLPSLQALQARPTRRWMAVSVEPALLGQESPHQLQPLDAADFLAAWGKADGRPDFAHQLGPGDPDWSIHTRSRDPQTTVEQTLALSFAQDGADVGFHAELSTTAGYNFQYRLRTPQDLKLTQVSLREEAVERAARWSQDKHGNLTVFLTGPVAGPQRLSLRGRLPTVANGPMPLPEIVIDAAQLRSSTIELYRRPSVLLKVEAPDGLAQLLDDRPDSQDAQFGRLVGRFRAEGDRPAGRPRATLILTPNHPRFDAQQLTRLRCDGGLWQAELDCRLRVTDGLLDEIRIDVPPEFDAAHAVVLPPAALDFDAEASQLLLRPPAAIEDQYRLTISAPLLLPPAEAPLIHIKGADQLRELLALPRHAQEKPITWRTSGLEKTALPELFAAHPDAQSFVTYQVTGESWRAVLTPQDHARGGAHVHWADVRIAWHADGAFHGVASFNLEPGDASQCPLRLPPGYRLLKVFLSGVPIEPLPAPSQRQGRPPSPSDAGPSEWLIPLNSRHLPQQVQVLFAGTLSDRPGGGDVQFHAPTLAQGPTRPVSWTIVGPPSFELDDLKDAVLSAPCQHELSRFIGAAAMIESGSTLLARPGGATAGTPQWSDQDELSRWYWFWARRLLLAQAALERELAPAGPSGPSAGHPSAAEAMAQRATTQVDRLLRQQAEIAKRLNMTDVFSQLAATPPLADDPAELWWTSSALQQRRSVVTCTSPQGIESVAISYRQPAPSRSCSLLIRLLAAVLLAGVVVLIILGLRRGLLAEWFSRWPHAIGVATGLAWWLWLSPSILGWGIVLVSLLAALLPAWKRPAPPPGSSIISLGSTHR